MVQSPDVYEPTTAEPVSETVIRALAATTDQRPVDLDFQLYDALDPDALDRLYEASGETGTGPRISFTLGPHRVVVDESRRVHVTTEPEQTVTSDRPVSPAGQVLRGSGSPWRLVFGSD